MWVIEGGAMTTHASVQSVPTAGVRLDAELIFPEQARSVVLFAHGSGSSRHSPRNRTVAAELNRHGHGTVLVDLLTTGEDRVDLASGHLRFDIVLLAGRLTGIVDWLSREPATATLPIGLFGASTGAAAALVAAADRPAVVWAVVSRGGRPDLAGSALTRVRAPTLLLVGDHDRYVLELNLQAAELLSGWHDVRLIEGAGHLFEERGALAQVTECAAAWFDQYLVRGRV
jgi:dienelactone hydrolase